MSDMSLLPVGSGMGSDALAAAGGAFVGGLFGNWFGNGFGGNGWGGRGGSGAGTKAWAFSPTVDMVTYLPWSSRFILPASNLK